ncbi:MAG: LysR family transcriptional regulator [Methyloversatilis discipulorum]|nr:LysR family transcriptional regulator [Methyloversatilis discipulorum]
MEKSTAHFSQRRTGLMPSLPHYPRTKQNLGFLTHRREFMARPANSDRRGAFNSIVNPSQSNSERRINISRAFHAMKKIPLSDLNWDDVRLFLAIYRAGSLLKASRQLSLDQSTLSRRLSQLELCLGGALFERQRTGLKPTDLAQVLVAPGNEMERAITSLQEELGSSGPDPTGTVRIAMMEGIGTMFVSRHLQPLLSRYPGLHIELLTSSSLVNVSRREADVFVSFFKPDGRGMSCQYVGDFKLYLYGSVDYLKRAGIPRSLDDLKDHCFVGYIQDLIRLDAVRWLDDIIIRPRMSFQSNSMLSQMSAASSGVGLVLLPKFSVINETRLLPVLPETAHVNRELWISVHQDLQFSKRVGIVHNYLRDLFASHLDWLNGPADSGPRGMCSRAQ